MDYLCIIGSIYATLLYKNYNHYQPPFTALDIEVLETVNQPEQILFTWNHDPRTSAVDNEELQNHRLGLYDWIPRCHSTAVTAIMKFQYDIIALSDSETSVGSPSPVTYFSQIFNGVFELLGPISEYPFTQV